MSSPASENAFTIERNGEVSVITASQALETLDPTLLEGASALVLDPLRSEPEPLVLFDLSDIDTFGSSFLALMIRCWKQVSTRGGTMVLTGVSEGVRDLLRITSLDTVWPIYDSRAEAIAALVAD